MPTITIYLPPHHDVVDAAFEARFPNYVFQKTSSVAGLARALPATDALLTSNPWYLPDVAQAVREHGKKVKWIQFTSVGIDTALTNGLPAGVPVTNVRGVRTGIIAGHAITLMMGLMRGLHVFEGYRRDHVWAKDELSHVVLTAEGKTLVIVGMGDIGRDCARKAKAFDMNVIGVSREGQAGGHFDEVVPRSQLHAILPKADVLLLALPLEDDTRHIIGAREIALMKPSALLVNIARGALIDEAALVAALQQKKIAGFATDVVEIEPLPGDCPLWDLENVLFSPHIAGHSDAASKHALAEMIADNMRRFAAGEPLRNIMRTAAAAAQ